MSYWLYIIMSGCPDPTRPNLTWPNLTWPDLIWPDITWHVLTLPDLKWPNLTWPYLTLTNFSWPYLTLPDLTWPNLTWLDLAWSYLNQPDLMWHDLTWLDLAWLDLTWPDLTCPTWPHLWWLLCNLLRMAMGNGGALHLGPFTTLLTYLLTPCVPPEESWKSLSILMLVLWIFAWGILQHNH